MTEQSGRRYRLPTEAEWEKAARGGQDDHPYPWGNELTPERCNTGSSGTTPVTQYPAGVSPFGCFDLVGNTREWTNTIWGNTLATPTFRYPYRHDQREEGAPHGPVYRIWCGGAYDDPPTLLGCSPRSFYSPDAALRNLGLRVVMEI